MTIAHVASQGASGTLTNTPSITKAYPGNVTVGSLLTVLVGATKFSVDDSVAGDLTKSAGTATIDTPTLDSQVSQLGSGIWAAQWSCLVTGSGSLTMQAAGYPIDSNLGIFIDEFSGTWGASRVEDSDQLSSNAGTLPVGPTMGPSAGAALFMGLVKMDGGTPLTPDGAFTSVAAVADEALAIYRIVSGTTSDAIELTSPSGFSWAITGAVYKESAGGATFPTLMGQACL